jgi:hypothetical protein
VSVWFVKWFESVSLVNVSSLDICDGNAKIIHAILTQVSLLILAVDCVVNDSVLSLRTVDALPHTEDFERSQ